MDSLGLWILFRWLFSMRPSRTCMLCSHWTDPVRGLCHKNTPKSSPPPRPPPESQKTLLKNPLTSENVLPQRGSSHVHWGWDFLTIVLQPSLRSWCRVYSLCSKKCWRCCLKNHLMVCSQRRLVALCFPDILCSQKVSGQKYCELKLFGAKDMRTNAPKQYNKELFGVERFSPP